MKNQKYPVFFNATVFRHILWTFRLFDFFFKKFNKHCLAATTTMYAMF